MRGSRACRSPPPGPAEVAGYYRGALACLRFVEARRPTKRRFGPDADARWKAFRGQLSASDRIDLLLRDANAEWPGAFGAREVFALPNVAEDEAFGVAWPGMDPVDGEQLWRELAGIQAAATASPREALAAVARAWGLTLEPRSVGAVDAAEKLIVIGPSAVASLAEAFAGRGELDRISGTQHVSQLASDAWAAYQAPEVREDPNARAITSDIFGLGAVAYLVLTGKPPGATALDVDVRLARDMFLDPRLDDPAAPEGRNGRDAPAWNNLRKLAERCAAGVLAQLMPAQQPLLLHQLGLVERYGLDDFLHALVQSAQSPASKAVFLLVPCPDTGGLPRINGGLAIPGLLPGQGLWDPLEWLRNKHNAAA